MEASETGIILLYSHEWAVSARQPVKMKPIAFVDLEVNSQSGKIMDFGCVRQSGATLHSSTPEYFRQFMTGAEFLCGHNLLKHDARFMQDFISQSGIKPDRLIDTLYLSPLLFPRKPYHRLLKDEKLQSDDLNNPLSDAIKARDLFYDELNAFAKLPDPIKSIFWHLLHQQPEFSGFFRYLNYQAEGNAAELIRETLANDMCVNVNLEPIIAESPIGLAYCVANILTHDRFSVMPPWVIKTFPETGQIMYRLRGQPCLEGCFYCNQALDPVRGLQRFFGYEAYRTFEGKPLQEMAVKAAIDEKSIIVVFPTGGGKSITFQVPALMSGESVKGLTVVISPLQSLMKDQVDNLEKAGITDAVTINGMIDPIERANAMERVQDGSASILYISPESLRSRTIEKMLLDRKIVRFVIDEAHCFSAWGQDFRVDYLYIGTFLKMLQEKKGQHEPVPVSCFTATAKPAVIEDIQRYFKDKLGLDLEILQTNMPRINLKYRSIICKDEEEKYRELRMLIESHKCPTIVYVTRTKRTKAIAERLTQDGFNALPYHGKMERRDRSANQDAFIAGEIPIMVATSAFGMGVDKKDVGLVVHFDISDSLENYVQEAGRAGRDEHIQADCYILFNEEDLDKHFVLLNQTRINIREIQQIWKAIKELTRTRRRVSLSALEIARAAGWDETIGQIETRVTTAIAALEEVGFLRRSQNMPRVYADSILCRNAADAYRQIEAAPELNQQQKQDAIRIMKKLISSRSQAWARDDEAESRVDYIADSLSLSKETVIAILSELRQIGLLADAKEIIAYMRTDDKENRSLQILTAYSQLERFLLTAVPEEETVFNIKELNERAEATGCKSPTVNKIRLILRFWQIRKMVRYQNMDNRSFIRFMPMLPLERLKAIQARRFELARFIIEYLYQQENRMKEGERPEEKLVDFSVHELLKAYQDSPSLIKEDYVLADVEDALLYLSRCEALTIEGGFLVIYNPMSIERLEDNYRRYSKDNYAKLERHYESKTQQIHIIGEYARRMISDYVGALQFVDDYFQYNYSSFLQKYFKAGRRDEISRNITPRKFQQLFGLLSPTQLKIIKDSESQYIAVLAGPGSGKTRILVHKLASLVLMEDIKFEQLLMLTFSRAAATEFKTRLTKLIGRAAHFIDIKTFHSYCFDLLGKVGTIGKLENAIPEAVARIRSGDVDPSFIAKSVLVIDEAQDMDAQVYDLIQVLMEKNEEMRVIAVGDDDQNIFEFRGSSATYLQAFMIQKNATTHELLTNFRSRSNLVDFANQYISRLPGRLKTKPIVAFSPKNGRIRIVRYRSTNLLVPFAESVVRSERIGSTAILTTTNNDALQIAGILSKSRLPARLIQSNEGFRLDSLTEIRYFMEQVKRRLSASIIDQDVWDEALRDLKRRFSRSELLDACMKLISRYTTSHPDSKYWSDFEIFVQESRLEDFISESADTIIVGTIHKAKGKEFDNVHLMLSHFSPETPESIRQIYVAMTRARSNLDIHLTGRYLDQIQTDSLTRVFDDAEYPLPTEIVIQAGPRDVFLDYFIQRQSLVAAIQSGDALTYRDGECLNEKGQSVLRFSKKYMEDISKMLEMGYKPDRVKTSFVIHWRKEDTEDEYRVILPELHFARHD